MGQRLDVEVKAGQRYDVEAKAGQRCDVEAKAGQRCDVEAKVGQRCDVEAKEGQRCDVEAKAKAGKRTPHSNLSYPQVVVMSVYHHQHQLCQPPCHQLVLPERFCWVLLGPDIQTWLRNISQSHLRATYITYNNTS